MFDDGACAQSREGLFRVLATGRRLAGRYSHGAAAQRMAGRSSSDGSFRSPLPQTAGRASLLVPVVLGVAEPTPTSAAS